MTDDLASDRLGAMWLHAEVARDPEGADMILDLADDRCEMLMGALVIAVRVLRESPVWYHNAAHIQRLLTFYAYVDDIAAADGG